ncbi:MAG TPA: undecaprenyl-diphosphatase UppP [Bryobacteraceae bacterium]|nr:undecaprenyl-diphosphatase UppP [Bryobacteraceae bacterium]
MPLLQVIVLGIIQGLTEFLPISSTAHLVVIPRLLGWPDQGLAFDIALHVGTLVAVLLYFFRDWLQVLSQGLGLSTTGGDPALRRNRGLLWLLVLGSIPAGLAGLLFQKQAETLWRENLFVIAGTSIGVGLIIWLAEMVGRRQRDLGHANLVDSITIGLAQACAVVPGVSRSGATIAAGLFRNLDRPAAARFSFLLSTPVIAGAALKDFYDLMKHEGGFPAEMRIPILVGIAVSAITGCAAIGFFMNFLRRRSLGVFVLYRLVFGIIVIALAVFRR